MSRTDYYLYNWGGIVGLFFQRIFAMNQVLGSPGVDENRFFALIT